MANGQVPITTLNRSQLSLFLPNEVSVRWAESLQSAAKSFVLGGGGGSLTPSGVTPGNYGTNSSVGAFTVEINGILTAAANTPIAITFSQVSGTVPITQGGTGQTTANAALNALLPSQGGNTGYYLQTNGTDASWQPAPGGGGGGTVTQVNTTAGDLTGGPITVTGTLGLATTGVAAGSYGSASQVAQITIDAKGRATAASSVTIAITGAQVSSNIAGNAGNVTGVVAVPNGGSGATTLTGYLKGNGAAAFTAVSNIPAADISGTLGVATGGTGANTFAAGYLKASCTSAFTTVTTIPQAAVTGLTASLASKADNTITITGATSLTGGGNLTANRTLSLVNDSASPGVSKYYGTDSGGTKGFFTLPSPGTCIALITNTGGGLVITNPTGHTTNIDLGTVPLGPVWDYSALHGAVGTADDTATLNAMVAAAADKATFLIPPYTAGTQGVYNTTGVVCAFEAEWFGVGMGTLKAITGAGILLDFPSNSLPEDGARARYVHDMEFDGDSATYRAGAYGRKFGDATNAVVQAVASRLFVHHLELGHWSYNTQEELNDHNRIYRCKWGRLVQSDPAAGGATATKIDHCTYQYNHVGAVYDNIARFALGTTGTLSNSSTAVTAVASTAGVTIGDTITGPGIKAGTTVAGFTVNTITLSQATTSTAAMAGVPLLIKNSAGYDTEWTETGTTFQGNGTCAFAAWGFNLVFNGCHFESNYQPTISTGTSTVPAVSARVVPVAPCYVSNSNVILANNCAGGETSSAVNAWTVVDGSSLIIRDSSIASASSILIDGDLTSSVTFYGDVRTLVGLINIPVARWPDTFEIRNSAGWGAAGDATQVRSATYANRNTNSNPRVPTVSLSGGATGSWYRDATLGPVPAVQFAATPGNPFTHSANTTAIGTPVSAGDKMVVSRLVRADTYTTIQFQLEAGSGNFFNYALRVTPYWQRVVFSSIATTGNATGFAPILHMFPVGSDAPKVYSANDMSFIGTDAELSEIVARGLFDDATIDVALVGTATWNPGAIGAGATVSTTITVNGLLAGDNVAVSTDIDTGALILNAWAGTNVINVRLTNPTAGSITPASMVLSGRAYV